MPASLFFAPSSEAFRSTQEVAALHLAANCVWSPCKCMCFGEPSEGRAQSTTTTTCILPEPAPVSREAPQALLVSFQLKLLLKPFSSRDLPRCCVGPTGLGGHRRQGPCSPRGAVLCCPLVPAAPLSGNGASPSTGSGFHGNKEEFRSPTPPKHRLAPCASQATY